MKVHVLDVTWQAFEARLKDIRREVFVAEQNVPESEEWDGSDPAATHFIAIDEAGRDLGCARLLSSGQIGRMAVRAGHRGSGIGADLLREAVKKAQSLGYEEVFLNAQEHALDFYARHDFLVEGEPFEEAGIPHRTMRRKLAIAFTGDVTPMQVKTPEDIPQQATAGLFFDSETQARAALCEGMRGARRHAVIYSHLLDPTYFDQADVISALSEFARRARTSEVRILIHSTSIIVSRGHRLLELARRLPSKFQIHRVSDEYDAPDSCFVGWDGLGYWRLPDYREPNGVMRTDDPVRARRLLETFDQLWQRGSPDPNLRVLRL